MKRLLFVFLIGCSNPNTYLTEKTTDSIVVPANPDIVANIKDVVEDSVQQPVDTTNTTVDALGEPPEVNVYFIDASPVDTIKIVVPKKDAGSGPPIGGSDTKGGIDVVIPDIGEWNQCIFRPIGKLSKK